MTPLAETHQHRTRLLSTPMLWLVWLPLLLITLLHYATGAHNHWIHDVLRRMYYLPILVAAFTMGVRGGFPVALLSSLAYIPHAFLISGAVYDPASTLNKALEIVLYNVIGVVAGVLADREHLRQKKLQQALHRQQLMAEQLVRAGRLAALGELVAGIAHEIKNPLHTIKGSMEIVDSIVPKDREESAMWTLLGQEVERLENIAESFLSFARPAQVKLSPVKISDLYTRVCELLRAQLKAHAQIRLEAGTIDPKLVDESLSCDADLISQAVLNLATNAIRAMDGHGCLLFGVERGTGADGSHVHIYVDNDGPPIDTADLERVFDPFFTRSEGGTGLGLSITERIAESHGGHAHLENLPHERGVHASLHLPLSRDF